MLSPLLIQIYSYFVFPKKIGYLHVDFKIKIINVVESERELENLLRKHAGTLFTLRIKMLIQIKKYSDKITLR